VISNVSTENTIPGEASPAPTETQAVPNLEALENPAHTVDPSGADSVAERPVPVRQDTNSSQVNSAAGFTANEIVPKSSSTAVDSTGSDSTPSPQTEIPCDAIQSSTSPVNSNRYLASIGASGTNYQHPSRTTTIELYQIEQGSASRRTGLHLTSPSPAPETGRPNQRRRNAMLNLNSFLESNGNNFYLVPHFRFTLAILIAVHVLTLTYFALGFSGLFIFISSSENTGLGAWFTLIIPLLILYPQLASVLTEVKEVYSVWRARVIH
jgi:hypothetical protein